jgi:glycosyltransferase involved in cell wall biosynthesis
MAANHNRIKVLHLITLSVFGGAQDNTFSTVELHDRSRFDVHLACNPDGAWIERARESADWFHPIPTLATPINPLKDLRAFLDLVRLLRREQFDLVHTHTAKAGFLGRLAAAACRVPAVHTYHAFPFHDFMRAWKRALFIQLEKCVRPCTDFFITLSENDRKEAARLGILDFARSAAVYTGIDFTKLDAPAKPTVSREKLKIPEAWQIVFMAGRLEPQKAPELLLDAFSQVVRVCPQTALVIAGDGPLRFSLERKIAALGLEAHVRLLGYRDDVPALIRLADVFAFSSRWEAMGRAMVEAMLLSKPVVAPAIYGIPEIVHHRETGLLYEVGRVEALAAGITQLLQNPDEARRMGYNARQLTRNLFDINVMVARIEKIYQMLLNTQPAVDHDRTLRGLEPIEPAPLLRAMTHD